MSRRDNKQNCRQDNKKDYNQDNQETNSQEIWLQKTPVIWLGALLCCALWGSASPCIKLGYGMFQINAADTATQILFAGIRFTLAGILTILIGSVLSRQFLHPVSIASGVRAVKLSLLQTVLQYYFFYVGLAHTSGVKASVIIAINVFVSILVASLIYHQERLTVSKMAGCAVGFAGVILINMSGMNFQMTLLGEGFIMCSTVAYAFSSVYMKRYSVTDHPVMLSGYQFLAGGIIMMVIGAGMGGNITTVTSEGILILFYLAIVSAVAYSIWGILLKHNPVSRVAVFGFMNPVCGVLLSTILLKESPQTSGATSFIALALVCVGIYVVNRGENGK